MLAAWLERAYPAPSSSARGLSARSGRLRLDDVVEAHVQHVVAHIAEFSSAREYLRRRIACLNGREEDGNANPIETPRWEIRVHEFPAELFAIIEQTNACR